MKHLRRIRVPMILGGAILAVACTSSGPSAAPPAAPAARRGTLGIEAVSISRAKRRSLSLPENVRGALVVEVVAGGPGALAGIRPGDVVERIGGTPIGNVCDFDAAADERPIETVSLVVRRAGKSIEASVVPVGGKSFFEEACRLGSPGGCYRAAREAEAGERRLALLESACRLGSAAACADAGIALARSGNRPQDAVATLERACALGSGAGCAHEAFLHATGTVVSRDDRRATELYVRGCDLGDAKSCYNAGVMSDDGRGTPKNPKTAAARYEEACEGGSPAACTNLGFLYENGRGVARDKTRAVAFYQRGCDGTRCQPPNRTGCVNVGRAYRDGIGVAKDPPRAEAIFREACDRPVDSGDVGAEANRWRACSLLGAMYLGTDDAKGRELSERGCEGGDAFGCFNAAAIYAAGSGVEANPATAASFLERACRAGDGEGCFDLGVAYEKGDGVSADREKAAEAFKKACILGFPKACGRKVR
ncbi:MAG TPA: PDZ domain-containing protein [Thermoanaerobaculia bacterium]|nr:PDZ domain-containing protein [Thermoanaerobaculia bacterium]